MIAALQPFECDPLAAQPPWLDCGAGGYRLYRGPDRPEAIDYGQPVGFAPAGAARIRSAAGLAHEPRQTWCYGLRAVSDAGMEEANTHVLCTVTAGPSGPSPRLPRPVDLTAGHTAAGVSLAWRVRLEAGEVAPASLEVLGPDGAGGWDAAQPLAVVEAGAGPSVDYRLTVANPPAALAVRARRGDWTGPSACVAVPAQGAVPAPLIL